MHTRVFAGVEVKMALLHLHKKNQCKWTEHDSNATVHEESPTRSVHPTYKQTSGNIAHGPALTLDTSRARFSLTDNRANKPHIASD